MASLEMCVTCSTKEFVKKPQEQTSPDLGDHYSWIPQILQACRTLTTTQLENCSLSCFSVCFFICLLCSAFTSACSFKSTSTNLQHVTLFCFDIIFLLCTKILKMHFKMLQNMVCIAVMKPVTETLQFVLCLFSHVDIVCHR